MFEPETISCVHPNPRQRALSLGDEMTREKAPPIARAGWQGGLDGGFWHFCDDQVSRM
jgi:hypothetical protein